VPSPDHLIHTIYVCCRAGEILRGTPQEEAQRLAVLEAEDWREALLDGTLVLLEETVVDRRQPAAVDVREGRQMRLGE
jgi:hypothetical protein